FQSADRPSARLYLVGHRPPLAQTDKTQVEPLPGGKAGELYQQFLHSPGIELEGHMHHADAAAWKSCDHSGCALSVVPRRERAFPIIAPLSLPRCCRPGLRWGTGSFPAAWPPGA